MHPSMPLCPRRCCPQTEGVGRCDGGPACPPRHHGAPVLTPGRGWRLLARGPGWRMHRPGHRAGASLRLRPAPSPTNPTLTPPHLLTLLRPPSTQPATNIQLGCVGRPPIPQRWSGCFCFGAYIVFAMLGTVAILAQGTRRAVAVTQAFWLFRVVRARVLREPDAS